MNTGASSYYKYSKLQPVNHPAIIKEVTANAPTERWTPSSGLKKIANHRRCPIHSGGIHVQMRDKTQPV